MNMTSTHFLALSLSLAVKPLLPTPSGGDAITAGRRFAEPVSVLAVAETTPVPSLDDAADDPAVWIHLTDPAKSLILGTDKKHGLFTYGLDGKQRQALAVGRLNNVDVRQGVGAGKHDIAVATNRTTKTIDVFLIDTEGKLTPAGSIPSGFVDPYGVCMYVSRTSGNLYVFACDKGGLVRQWRLTLGGEKPVAAVEVRSFEVGGQSEGMVCDEEAGSFFIGEERTGVWRYPAEPTAELERTLIAATVPHGPLVADVEGLAIARPKGKPAYLVVSSQGNNSFHLFDLAPPHPYVGSVRVSGRSGSTAADGGAVQETDGIEICALPLGPAFPEGILIVQDGENAPLPQNFKLISLGDVLRAVRPAGATQSGRDGEMGANRSK